MSQKDISLFVGFSVLRNIDIMQLLSYTMNKPQNIVDLCKLSLYFVHFNALSHAMRRGVKGKVRVS